MEVIRKGECLQFKAVLYTYSSGNNLGNLYFLWCVPESETILNCLQKARLWYERLRQLFRLIIHVQ